MLARTFQTPIFHLVALFAVSACAVKAEDTVRMVLMKTSAKDAALLRTAMADEARGGKSDSMDVLLKRPGFTTYTDFAEANPWRGEPIEIDKEIPAGTSGRPPGLKFQIDGGKTSDGAGDLLITVATLPAGDGFLYQQNIGGMLYPASGRWIERASWGNGKDTVMLWQFPTAEPGKESGNTKESYHVEVRFFQAEAADVTTLSQSKPETREKAYQWISGRAQLWREAGFHTRGGEQALSTSGEGKKSDEDTRITILLDFSNADNSLKADFQLLIKPEGKEIEAPRAVSANATPGVWEFSPLEGVIGANLMAFRIVKDSK